MTCNEFVRAIDAYLDDELSVVDILRVHAHLLACELCHRVMESEATLHSLLADDSARDQIPGALRDRIIQRVAAEEDVGSFGEPSGARARGGSFAALSALLAAAALIGLLILVPLHPGGTGPVDLTPLAAELAAKHLLYSGGRGAALEITTSEPAEMTRWGERRLGLSLRVPRLEEVGGQLVGGRVSSLADAPAAYLLYDWGGHRISLFVTRSVSDGRRSGSESPADGVELSTAALRGVALAWWEEEDEGQLYAAASTGDPSRLRQFALLCMRSGQPAIPD